MVPSQRLARLKESDERIGEKGGERSGVRCICVDRSWTGGDLSCRCTCVDWSCTKLASLFAVKQNLFNKEQHARLWVISLSYSKQVVATSVAPLMTTNPTPVALFPGANPP
ncbi:hypothetical protein HaLaN_24889 [Haematococcus lacustris]|uniref:Uncharacterized protein n=1 Tax=Haematococcus lacustris TaxID=44745 RepID=A0A6A0A1Y6_HAELA|nr:hypothetical protein HaLaN_24889 [Haematococcus lacustris]